MKTRSVASGSKLYSFLFVLPVVALLIALGACSSNSATCEDSKCATGNKCIATGTTTQCELLCTSQAGCPANYHCAASKDATNVYCQPDGVKFAPAKGQWGDSCDPAKGLDSNPDCDTANQFWCNGRNPTDGQAYCTQFQCKSDNDCGKDYVCQTINTYPNVTTVKRQFGETTTVCIPRTYCQPCANDVDCVSANGAPASCATGDDGVKFCTTTCSNDGNCDKDAKCDTDNGVCKPRAGTCKGDGSLCAPCYSDKDCPQGVCAVQEYSGEHYCTVKSTSPCTVSNTACATPGAYCTQVSETAYGCTDNSKTTCDPKNNKANFGCPTTSAATPDISCTYDDSSSAIPQDQCFGLVTFGRGANAAMLDGCWTKSD